MENSIRGVGNGGWGGFGLSRRMNICVGEVEMERHLPLLDFVEATEEGNGHEDNDCFLAVTDFELESSRPASVSRSYSVAPLIESSAISLPHEQTQTAEVSTRSSCRGCWSQDRTGHSRCWTPAQRGAVWTSCSPQSY